MSIYQPKRKTSAGVEDVTFPISSVEGLSEKIDGKIIVFPFLCRSNCVVGRK